MKSHLPEAQVPSAPKRNPWSILIFIFLLAFSGCSGCQPKTAAQKKKEAEEARKRLLQEKQPDPFTIGQITPLPSEVKLLKPLVTDPAEIDAAEEEKRKEEEKSRLGNKVFLNFVKPGHWTGLILPIRSNQVDIAGDLIASTIDSKTQELAEVDNTLFRFTLSRPITLAKGQAKYLESIAYVPKSLQSGANTVRFRNEVISSGRRIAYTDEPTTAMAAFQYFFLVVAANPDQYTFLRVSNFNSPANDLDEDRGKFYHIVAPKFENELPLPIHAATWTNLAYVLWDEVDAKRVDAEQQKAMIDWLQWGGQLVINGPRTLDMLRGTFLDEYLPAGANKSLTIDAQALEVLNQNWYIEPRTELARKDERRKIQLKPNETIAGVELSLRSGGTFVPGCGELLAERRVGRGRIVVSAFPLYQRALINWSCYDNFLNNAVLRRLPRRYQFGDSTMSLMSYLTPGVIPEDPRVTTTLRYFSRDVGDSSTMVAEVEPNRNPLIPGGLAFNPQSYDEEEKRRQASIDRASAADVDTNDWHFAGYASSVRSGVAGWNDSGACPDAARNALTEAAGIEIPERNFVLRMMLVYLAALVPLNWLVFRLLGRLEWAWIAAPIMAVIAAVAVIRLAQLDIGFARSQTEINVVEVHGGYERAHVTRYAALYTSLSSSYRIGFEDPSGIVLPFSTYTGGNTKFMPRLTDTYKTVSMQREANVQLSGFGVDSNSTGLLHAEHMLPLGGAFKVVGDAKAGWTLQNDSKIGASAAIALYRDENGVLNYAPLSEIAPAAKIPLEWRKVKESLGDKPHSVDAALSDEIQRLEQSAVTGGPSAAPLRLRKLIELACGKLRIAPGEMRLVAMMSDRPGGMDVRPQAAQVNAATLLLVHLKQGPLPTPQSDENMKLDVKSIDVPDPLDLDENPDQIPDPAAPSSSPPGAAATPATATAPATGSDSAKVP